MIDLHAHILWGMDDGASTPEVSLAMMELARGDGITDLVATSHYLSPLWPFREESYGEVLALTAALAREGDPPLTLHPGGEWFWSEEIFSRLADPGALTLAGSRYLLLELPALFLPAHLDQFLFRLQLAGKIPVLAHPERHLVLSRHPDRLLPWVERGMLIQLTAGSLTGDWGEEIRTAAVFLTRERRAHFLGSDAHDAARRPPVLSRGVEAAGKLAGMGWARTLVEDNPRRVLANLPWET